MTDRHGTSIRTVDKGHFNDITLEVVTMSASSALLLTNKGQISHHKTVWL